jgi:hypothetical protein
MPEENQLPEIRLIATRNVPLGWAVESSKNRLARSYRIQIS